METPKQCVKVNNKGVWTTKSVQSEEQRCQNDVNDVEVFVINFEQILFTMLVFPLLTLSK